jgi:hypothetical protein
MNNLANLLQSIVGFLFALFVFLIVSGHGDLVARIGYALEPIDAAIEAVVLPVLDYTLPSKSTVR